MNVDNMRSKGRDGYGDNFGERNGQAVLTEDQARQVYELAWSGQYTQDEIGEMFGVTRGAVKGIKLKKTWKYLWSNNEGDNPMPEEKYRPNHNGSSAAERIAARLKPSNDTASARTVIHQGSGPRRVVHTIHGGGGQGGLSDSGHPRSGAPMPYKDGKGE
jgi:hypothetical protein